MMTTTRAIAVINRLEELQLTRVDLANAAQVSERAVYHWLNYDRVPRLTFSQTAGICKLLDWTIEELADSYQPPTVAVDKPVSNATATK